MYVVYVLSVYCRVAGTGKKEIIIQASLDLKMAAVNAMKHFG